MTDRKIKPRKIQIEKQRDRQSKKTDNIKTNRLTDRKIKPNDRQKDKPRDRQTATLTFSSTSDLRKESRNLLQCSLLRRSMERASMARAR